MIPTLVHGSNVVDFQWDPFDYQRLAVACDDGVIKLWRIAEGGLNEPTNEPEREFNAHSDKIYFLKFHPTAKDVLASGKFKVIFRVQIKIVKLRIIRYDDQTVGLNNAD